jgi:hypothetical protein
MFYMLICLMATVHVKIQLFMVKKNIFKSCQILFLMFKSTISDFHCLNHGEVSMFTGEIGRFNHL